ncbi:DNA polymerase III subunit gamma/tau [Roseibacillus ishigakijimensis]|uniref:DNA polymerase III subunit gamma/tau n=1 Tax=Roseibacillus ishigakijimensis TaxID=454146 RepID=A0A934VL47_9BACT|nr:DNA polymerase III subunit gamma/tau [Roseibacillus ishigakijimensis]MBK1834304.1 DNA polymerase III subunit gamma/tau [Roseibacillus ishigakijimensis]
MSYQVFARKYRPRTFADVLGQDHVVRTLRNAIEQGRLAHAYLFVGPRGTGKTSTARIFAKALNNPGGPAIDFDPDHPELVEIAEGRSLDVLEIDGASNNGVEQVRQLRDTVQYAPAKSRFKIYYIDEVHMLSNAAFNALLKTLEEPPAHVKFIFATTEPNKILPTIISRCQRFDLRPIPTPIIAEQLLHIAREENVSLAEPAAWAIAKGADGGMRDAQSMLDQLVAFCGETISEEDVQHIFGFTSGETIARLVTALFKKDPSLLLNLLNELSAAGKNLSQLLQELIGTLRALLIQKIDAQADREGLSREIWDQLTALTAPTPTDRLLAIIDLLSSAEAGMRWAANKQLHLELALIRSVQALDEIRITDVITALEKGGLTDEPAPFLSPPAQKAPSAPAPSPEPEPEPVPEAKNEPEPAEKIEQEPETGEPAATPEPSPAPEPARATDSAPPAPPEEPSVQAPQEETEPKPATPKTQSKSTAGALGALDRLMEEAVEEREDEPEPEPKAPATKKEAAPATPAEKAPPSPPADDFHKDPLIQDAIEIFKGKLRA